MLTLWFLVSLSAIGLGIFILLNAILSNDPDGTQGEQKAGFALACVGSVSLVICALTALIRWIFA